MTLPDAMQFVTLLLGSVGGAAALIVASAKWFGDHLAERLLEGVRVKHARDLEHLGAQLEERIRDRQARIDQVVHVTRAQFEVEFAAYRDIWRALDGFRSALLSLRPSVSTAPVDETEDQRESALRDRLGRLVTAFNAFREAVDTNSPFYSERVSEALGPLVDVGNLELLQVRTSTDEERFSSQWYDDGDTNRDEVRAKAEVVACLIRRRLASLSIID